MQHRTSLQRMGPTKSKPALNCNRQEISDIFVQLQKSTNLNWCLLIHQPLLARHWNWHHPFYVQSESKAKAYLNLRVINACCCQCCLATLPVEAPVRSLLSRCSFCSREKSASQRFCAASLLSPCKARRRWRSHGGREAMSLCDSLEPWNKCQYLPLPFQS